MNVKERLSTILEPENRIWWLVIPTVLDRAITLQHFHLEANPLVDALGPAGWVLLTAGLLTVAGWAWYECELWNSAIAQAFAIGGGVIGCLAVLLNLLVIF